MLSVWVDYSYVVLFSSFYFLSCLSEEVFVCFGCATACRAQNQRRLVNNLFLCSLLGSCFSGLSGRLITFPSLKIIKPRLKRVGSLPRQDCNVQIKTSTRVDLVTCFNQQDTAAVMFWYLCGDVHVERHRGTPPTGGTNWPAVQVSNLSNDPPVPAVIWWLRPQSTPD